jgi:oligopeptide/dipeptide ABC transporter ATP-binding protein
MQGNSYAVSDPLLAVRHLRKSFSVRTGFLGHQDIQAVDDLSLNIPRGKAMGLVGESGCGKTTAVRCILRLLEPDSGQVSFDGRDMLSLDRSGLREARRLMQIVFQDARGSLTPRMRVGRLLREPLERLSDMPGRDKERRVQEVLESVGLQTYHSEAYPSELSGGQAQRVAIARALVTRPALLILDEPTSALDVSVRGQILLLLRELQQAEGLTYLLISHDLSIVRQMCDLVCVMYAGRLMETGPVEAVLDLPRHPYTIALLSSVPSVDRRPSATRTEQSAHLELRGDAPGGTVLGQGCPLYPRCPLRAATCLEPGPPLFAASSDHGVACTREETDALYDPDSSSHFVN